MSSPNSPPGTSPVSAAATYPGKKRYTCNQCQRGFTTAGHLARHARVHTGERNHKCPFPGCETRCSRQDNLQQHYRIHMSPGSRRTSGAATRAHMTKQQKNAGGQDFSMRMRLRTRSPPIPLLGADNSVPAPNPHCIAAPTLPSPTINSLPPPPDTPPPLIDAYRPSQPPESVSDRSSARSSPEASYPSPYASSNATLHPSSRISHSPENTYPQTTRNHLSAFGHSPTEPGYGYTDNDQAPSPASSAGPSVSPQSPYAFTGHYGLQHGAPAHMPSGAHIRSGASLASLRQSASNTASSPTYATPPIAQSNQYSQSYHNSSSALLSQDSSNSLSMAGFANQSRAQDLPPASQGSASSIAPISSQSYAHQYLPTVQSAQNHYSSHGTPSQSRQGSPPVVLAPIQTDRLARGTSQTLPRTLSHTTNAQSQAAHISASSQSGLLAGDRVQAHVGLAAPYSSHVHQPQPQHPHNNQAQAHYPYSSYPTLSGHNQHHNAHHHDSWRSDAYSGRAGLAHSMSSAGLAV